MGMAYLINVLKMADMKKCGCYWRYIKVARKVILSSVRFDKKLNELKENGYIFYKEIKICDTENAISDSDKRILKEKDVEDVYLEYPLSEIGLYFINSEDNTMCLVAIEGCGRSARIETSVGGICDVSADEDYFLEVGETASDSISRYELTSDVPMFYNYLSRIGMIVEEGNNDFSTEAAVELAIDYDQGYSSSFHSLYGWKYKSIMLNNNVSEAMFRFRDLSLDDLLRDLSDEGYRLVSLGLLDVRSIVDSVTVCGFQNEEGYLYVIFYYGVEEEEFMVKIMSHPYKLIRVRNANKVIPLFNISVSSADETSTLIRGFDFDNFEEFNLV